MTIHQWLHYSNPTPTATPQINQDDITFRALIGEIDSNLDAIRADIQNQANAENIDGIMSALDRLKYIMNSIGSGLVHYLSPPVIGHIKITF